MNYVKMFEQWELSQKFGRRVNEGISGRGFLDDSKQQEWEKEKEEIVNKYKGSQLNKELARVLSEKYFKDKECDNAINIVKDLSDKILDLFTIDSIYKYFPIQDRKLVVNMIEPNFLKNIKDSEVRGLLQEWIPSQRSSVSGEKMEDLLNSLHAIGIRCLSSEVNKDPFLNATVYKVINRIYSSLGINKTTIDFEKSNLKQSLDCRLFPFIAKTTIAIVLHECWKAESEGKSTVVYTKPYDKKWFENAKSIMFSKEKYSDYARTEELCKECDKNDGAGFLALAWEINYGRIPEEYIPFDAKSISDFAVPDKIANKIEPSIADMRALARKTKEIIDSQPKSLAEAIKKQREEQLKAPSLMRGK